MTRLDEIRRRNEEDRAGLVAWPHRYCEDTFYACPLHPEYCGNNPRECDCDNEERTQRVRDTDYLLSELERKDKALRPFARIFGAFVTMPTPPSGLPDQLYVISTGRDQIKITLTDCRAAREALAEDPDAR